jgi:hypothetical protein
VCELSQAALRYARAVDLARDLLAQELLVLVRSTEGIEDGVLSQDTAVDLLIVNDDDGRPVLPAFTTEKALNRWAAPGAPFLILPARTVMDLLASDDTPWDRLVVDTNGPGTFTVSAAEARQLLNA